MWEKEIKINEVKEIRSRVKVFFGCGAIEKIDFIAKELKLKGINRVIVVSGKGAYKLTGAWEVVQRGLELNGLEYTNYAKVTPNPTTKQINEAKSQAIEFGAQAVIAIGGGSAIDTGKSVAILLKYPEKSAEELYEFKFEPNKACEIIAINLTHGTGTEANRFAVATILEKNFKPAIAYDCIYPEYSIDDPNLMKKLSLKQTLYVSIDAVNHVCEAATSKVASPYTITLAKQTIDLVVKYLPKVIENLQDCEARYFLLYASLLGGICFDNGLLHYTHALEHPLSAIKPDLSHGLGLAMLLPAVVENIYNEKSEILKYIFSSIKKDPESGSDLGKSIEKWLCDLSVTQKLKDEGFTENDVEKLTQLTFETPSLDLLLGLAPNEATKERVKKIYTQSLELYK